MALKPKIQALIDFANETTEAGDVTLGDAVKTLADGYNGGANVPSAPLVIPSGEMSAKLAALLAYSNEVTGAGDTRMGDAIKTLCDGYRKEEPTPPGVVWYDWLASDGTAYINSLVPMDRARAFDISWRWAATTQAPDMVIMGARSTNDNYGRFFPVNVYQWGIYLGAGSSIKHDDEVASAMPKGQLIIVHSIIKSGGSSFWFEVQELSYQSRFKSSSGSISYNSKPMYIFRNNWTSISQCNSNMHICDIKLFQEDGIAITHHFRPCTYNGIPGMWEMVEGKFYGNANTSGSFTAGND